MSAKLTLMPLYVKIHVLAFICLLSLVHRQAGKRRFDRICLTFKASVNRFPKNLGTQRVTWSKFHPEDPQSWRDLCTLHLSGAFRFVHVNHCTYFIEGKEIFDLTLEGPCIIFAIYIQSNEIHNVVAPIKFFIST